MKCHRFDGICFKEHTKGNVYKNPSINVCCQAYLKNHQRETENNLQTFFFFLKQDFNLQAMSEIFSSMYFA